MHRKIQDQDTLGFGFVWFCFNTYNLYGKVLKWFSGSFSIDCGSIEPVAYPNILLPTVLNGEGRNGSQFFI